MPDLPVPVKIFDPVLPFKAVEAKNPALDTWHNFALITTDLKAKLPFLETLGMETLSLSSGMSMKVPKVSLGLQIGSIKIDTVHALVVDEGFHDVLLGANVLEQIFRLGRDIDWKNNMGGEVRVTSERKDDPASLALEIFPVQAKIDLREFESFLRYQRRLYNILLIANREIPSSRESLDDIVEHDTQVPKNLRLQLQWIDAGSIWITLKGGSLKALGYLATLFETGASAKLSQQLAEAKSAETKADIDLATRNATAQRVNDEQKRLSVENRSETYNVWRKEVRERFGFFDEMVSQIDDPEIVARLKKMKTDAIGQIAEQELLPLVRNYPLPFDPNASQLRLSSGVEKERR